MRLRPAAVFAAAALGAAASASYDLLLIAENPVGGPSRVVRYDPVSNRSLGSFGAHAIPGAARDVVFTVDGQAAVLGQGFVSRFDYSTGRFHGGHALDPGFHSIGGVPGSPDILAGGHGPLNTSPARRFAPDGSVARSFSNRQSTTGGYVSRRFSDRVYFGDSAGGQQPGITIFFLSTGAQFGSYTTTPTQTGTGYAGSFRDLAEDGDGRMYALYGDLLGNLRVLRFTLGLGGTLTGATTLGPFFGAMSARTSIAAGHDGMLYVLNDNVLHRFHGASGTLMGSETLPFAAGTLGGMDAMVAPEPGTLIALGAGLAAIARRRRRR